MPFPHYLADHKSHRLVGVHILVEKPLAFGHKLEQTRQKHIYVFARQRAYRDNAVDSFDLLEQIYPLEYISAFYLVALVESYYKRSFFARILAYMLYIAFVRTLIRRDDVYYDLDALLTFFHALHHIF